MNPSQPQEREPQEQATQAPTSPAPFEDTVSDDPIAITPVPRPVLTVVQPSPPAPSPAKPAGTIKEFPESLQRGNQTVYPATIANTKHLLNHLGITTRYNVIKKKTEIILPAGTASTSDNADNVSMTHIISAAACCGLPTGHVPAYVEAIADQAPYNPVELWIASRPWDGQDRLPSIYETLETQEDFPQQLKKTLIYRWLLSAVAAALKPEGFFARGVLTLQGAQSMGKTSWIRNLVSDEALRALVIKVDHQIDTSNKDTLLGAIAHWIVELGELDSTFRKDVARLKGFLTSDHDKLRRPYARGESEYERRTVFAATVNDGEFLVDMTGNTRWWTLPVVKINYDHGIDMQQLFAQLAVDYRAGMHWWLTKEEEDLLEARNKDHLSVSAIREKLKETLDHQRKVTKDDPYMTASEVLRKVLDMPMPTNPQAKECGACLRELFGPSMRVKGQARWRIPLTKEQRGQLGGVFTKVY